MDRSRRDGRRWLKSSRLLTRLWPERRASLLVAVLDDAVAVEERPNMPGTIDEWPNWCLALPIPLEQVEQSELAAAIARRLNGTHADGAQRRVARRPGVSVADLPVPPPVAPMLAKLARELPSGDYIYEPKWDGFRCIVFRNGDDVELGSRNELPLTRYFPEVVEAVRRWLPERAVLDGEVVVAGPAGLDFDALSQRVHPAESRVRMLAEKTPASFVAFDLLALGRSRPAQRAVPRTQAPAGDRPFRGREPALVRGRPAWPVHCPGST